MVANKNELKVLWQPMEFNGFNSSCYIRVYSYGHYLGCEQNKLHFDLIIENRINFRRTVLKRQYGGRTVFKFLFIDRDFIWKCMDNQIDWTLFIDLS